MNWLLRVDVAVLGVMLVYTLVLVVRVSRCYRLARHRGIDSSERKGIVAKLQADVRSLKSIASTAPYLGLLGTCVGILSAFTNIGMERHAAEALVILRMAAALVPCAAGIIVTVPATWGYTHGGTRLELRANGLPSRNRLGTRPFTEVTSFGLIAAWLIAILIRVFFLNYNPLPSPKGFNVGIASVPCETSEKFIVLQISNRGAIFVNKEEQDWRSLQSRLSEIYRVSPYSVVYLSADDGVPYETVAGAIDIVKSMPKNTVQLVTPGAVKAGCSAPPLASSFTPHRSR